MAKAPVKKNKPDIVDSAAKLPRTAQIGVIVGVGFLLCFLFYFLFYLPYSEEAAEKESSIEQTAADIKTQEGSLKKHQAVEALSVPIEDAYLYMQKYLPSENEMPRLVQMVSEIGAQAGLTDGVTLFAPKLPAVIRDNYAEIPFTMNLEGEFLTVLTFLYDFSRMDRIVNITDVSIGSAKMVDEKREVLHISVKCSGSTYRSLTEAEITAQTTPKK
ncbi:hypothetical protein C4J81_08240 [Deltaproteobacteria bacterium Smac51]|nr:hypothetical protein C4J81_08240 [Deltaproteobacteria bacterium Smac51]